MTVGCKFGQRGADAPSLNEVQPSFRQGLGRAAEAKQGRLARPARALPRKSLVLQKRDLRRSSRHQKRPRVRRGARVHPPARYRFRPARWGCRVPETARPPPPHQTRARSRAKRRPTKVCAPTTRRAGPSWPELRFRFPDPAPGGQSLRLAKLCAVRRQGRVCGGAGRAPPASRALPQNGADCRGKCPRFSHAATLRA